MRVEGSRGEIGLLIWEPGLQVAPKTVIAVFVKSNLPSNSPLRDMEISPSSRINLVYWDVVGRRGPSLGYVKALKMARSGIDNSTVYEFALSHLLSYLCCLIKRKERGRGIGSLWVVESCIHTRFVECWRITFVWTCWERIHDLSFGLIGREFIQEKSIKFIFYIKYAMVCLNIINLETVLQAW